MMIFSYRTEPLNGREGDDGGFSIELYGNGNLRYCMYKLFQDIQILEMFKVSKESVYEIYEMIEKARKQLEELPERLDNGSEGGMLNEFRFGECRWVTAVNIQETFLKGVMLTKHQYYREYKENMKRENTVLKLFREICRVLKGTGVDLSLNACEIRQDCKLKVTW